MADWLGSAGRSRRRLCSSGTRGGSRGRGLGRIEIDRPVLSLLRRLAHDVFHQNALNENIRILVEGVAAKFDQPPLFSLPGRSLDVLGRQDVAGVGVL